MKKSVRLLLVGDTVTIGGEQKLIIALTSEFVKNHPFDTGGSGAVQYVRYSGLLFTAKFDDGTRMELRPSEEFETIVD